MTKTKEKTAETLDQKTGEVLPPEGQAAGQEVATATAGQLPALAADYGADAGVGMENIGKGELKIPFLVVLQSNSPAVEQQTIPGAKPGMILNTATQELYDGETGIGFVACFRDHNYVKRIPIEAGGGFKGTVDPRHPDIAPLRKKFGDFAKLLHPDGTELIETYYLGGWFVAPGGFPERSLIGFKSTQIKKYQFIVGRLINFKYPVAGQPGKHMTPAIFAHRWVLGTQREQNKKGKFWGWSVRLAADGPPQNSLMKPTDELYQMGKEFNTIHREGRVMGDYDAEQRATAGEDDPEAQGGYDPGQAEERGSRM